MTNTETQPYNPHTFLVVRDGHELDESHYAAVDAQERREQLRAIGHDIVSGLLHRTATAASALGHATIEYLDAAAEAGKQLG